MYIIHRSGVFKLGQCKLKRNCDDVCVCVFGIFVLCNIRGRAAGHRRSVGSTSWNSDGPRAHRLVFICRHSENRPNKQRYNGHHRLSAPPYSHFMYVFVCVCVRARSFVTDTACRRSHRRRARHPPLKLFGKVARGSSSRNRFGPFSLSAAFLPLGARIPCVLFFPFFYTSAIRCITYWPRA